MNTTNTGGNRKAKIAVVNFHAALSKIRLISDRVDALSWGKLLAAMKTLDEIGSIAGADSAKILSRIPDTLPEVILRRDRGTWDASIYFMVGADIFFMAMSETNLVQLSARIDGVRLKSDSFKDSAEVDRIFQELDRAAQLGLADRIGKKTYLGLWVSRGYDTMQRVAQIRQLRQKFDAEFAPPMVISEVGNLMPVEIAFPFVTEVERVADPKAWRQTLPVETGLVLSLKTEWPHQNEFHKEIIAFLRSFAEDRPADRAHEFVLFISFEAEKRQMANQEEFFDTLISRLLETKPDLRVLVNGMTGNAEGVDLFEDIRDFENQIIQRLSARHPQVMFQHLHGQTFLAKAQITSNADFFVAPLGTAALLPQVMNIPGVVYNSPEMMQQIKWFLDAMPSRAQLLPAELSSTLDEDLAFRKYKWGWNSNTRQSYQLDVAGAIDFCLDQVKQAQPQA